MGIDNEALFVVATGNASCQLNLMKGVTLDNVIYNKLGAKDALSYVVKVSDLINNSLLKAPSGYIIIDLSGYLVFISFTNSSVFDE